MNNEAATFFDDIIKAISIESESAPFVNINTEVLNEFYSITGVKQQPAPPSHPPIQQQPAGNTHANINHPHPQTQTQSSAAPVAQGMSQADLAAISKMNFDKLLRSTKTCNRCPLFYERKNPVPGMGNPQADLMFIGEAPGRDEDEQGVPFVGEAGQLLTKMINAMQFTRSDVYITNIVKCHPPKNRNPEQMEAEACIAFLKRQIELIQPKVIVLLGAVPMQYLVNQCGITKYHGLWLDYNGIKVMPTFHPAYLLRNPNAKKDVWNDLQKVMQFFGKTHSPVTKR